MTRPLLILLPVPPAHRPGTLWLGPTGLWPSPVRADWAPVPMLGAVLMGRRTTGGESPSLSAPVKPPPPMLLMLWFQLVISAVLDCKGRASGNTGSDIVRR